MLPCGSSINPRTSCRGYPRKTPISCGKSPFPRIRDLSCEIACKTLVYRYPSAARKAFTSSENNTRRNFSSWYTYTVCRSALERRTTKENPLRRKHRASRASVAQSPFRRLTRLAGLSPANVTPQCLPMENSVSLKSSSLKFAYANCALELKFAIANYIDIIRRIILLVNCFQSFFYLKTTSSTIISANPAEKYILLRCRLPSKCAFQRLKNKIFWDHAKNACISSGFIVK